MLPAHAIATTIIRSPRISILQRPVKPRGDCANISDSHGITLPPPVSV